MAHRTCPSCGADVSGASAFCPRCGADLEAKLIELGGPTPVRSRGAQPNGRPKRTRLLAGLAAVVVGGLAVSSLVSGGEDGGGEPDDGGEVEATTTTLADLSDRAPLLGERSRMSVAIAGQSNVQVDLDSGSVYFLDFRIADVAGDELVLVSDLGVQLWGPSVVEGGEFTALDEAAAGDAHAGDTVVWSVSLSGTEVRAIRFGSPSGLLLDRGIPQGEPIGVLGDELVLSAPGGTFLLAADGSSRQLATGTPVAVGRDQVVVVACDADLTCVVQSVGETGEVLQTLPVDESTSVVHAAVGPAGQVAWIGGDAHVYVDGRSRFPLPTTAAVSLDWSPDGRWLVGSFGRSDIWVLDTTDGPEAEPEVIDLGRNVYPEEVFVVGR